MTDIRIPMHAFSDTCQRDDCNNPTPWDMSAVAINQSDVYCSPECAQQSLDEYETVNVVTLHDPQDGVEFPENVSEGSVDCGRDVSGCGDASRALGAFEEWMSSEFRP